MTVQENPFLSVIELLKARVKRQVAALKETELQLESAKSSAVSWEDQQRNLPLGKGGK